MTTVPVMVVAQGGMPSWWLILATVIGGTLAAGGANAINMYVDRDIDALMRRTERRPLVTGVVSPAEALVFAIGLEIVAFALLWGAVNLLSALLALSACLFYVFVYTLWLKRTSRQNIVIGGAAGAMPVLIGWSSVTNSLALAPWVLFGVVFFWTPPHFWALAVKYRDDYSAAGVPMLPSVAPARAVGRQIVAYAAVVLVLSLWFGHLGNLGIWYFSTAIAAGAVWMWLAVRVMRDSSPGTAMRLFTFSITYVTLLFGAMALDVLV